MPVIYEPRGAALEYSPLACNLRKGCTHGCRYCYAPACLRVTPEEFHATSEPRDSIIERMATDLRRLKDRTKRLLLCFTTDPYQPHEEGLTRRAIRLLNDHRQPFEVLTKGGTRAARDFDLYAEGDGAFATTLLFTDDADRKEWEPNAAPVEDRVEAIKQAHALGIPTWVSVEPVIDPAQALELIRTLAPWVSEFRVGKLNHHAYAKTVDWRDFAGQALAALQESGRDYMVKDALARFLPPGAPTRRGAEREVTAVTTTAPRQAGRQLALL